MNPYVSLVLQEFLPYLGMALGAVLFALASWAAHQIGKKANVEISAAQEQMLWDAAHKGVAYAEEWARKKLATEQALPAGADKLKTALEFMKTQVSARNLDKVAEEKLLQMLESALHVSRPVLEKPVAPAPAPAA